MLALIAKLEGATGLLFHVEQRSNETVWRYRVRYPASRHESLRGWQRERSISGEGVYFPLLDPTVPVEAQWREEDGDWEDAAPHEFVEGVRAPFRVKVLQARDKRKDPWVRATAMVRGQVASFLLEMPARELVAGEVLEVEGVGYGFGPGHHLRAANEFALECAAYAVLNRGAGQAALLPVREAVPGTNPLRETAMVLAGRLSPEEIALLFPEAGSHA